MVIQVSQNDNHSLIVISFEVISECLSEAFTENVCTIIVMSSSLLSRAALCVATAEAFIAPAAFVSRRPPTATASWLFNGLDGFATSQVLADDDLINAVGSAGVFQSVGGIVDTVTTVLTGIIGVVFFLVGLTYVMAAVIIPQAAQQLERQTKELDPELWASYEAQLEPGQTMDQRPDLMQELGEKMQALMEAKFKEQQQQQQQQQVQVEATQGKEGVRPQVVDAEIVSKDTSKVGGDDDPWAG